MTADKITYNDPTKVSFAEGHVVYKEEKLKECLQQIRCDMMILIK